MSTPPQTRILALLLVLAATRLAAEPAFERTFAVESRGWLRVPLSEEILSDGPAGGLEVIAPNGESVSFCVVSDEEGRSVPVSVTAVRRVPSGWEVDLDAGEGAPHHDRLHFDFEQRVALSGVALSSSSDGRRYRPLTSGDLFRLGTGGGLSEVSLAYPSTDDRYLRLTWPVVDELPELQRVVVDEVGSGRRTVAVDVDCASTAGLTICSLRLPADPVAPRALELELSATAAAGVRLLRPANGRWELTHQAVWETASEQRHVLPIAGLEEGTSRLRLELSSTTGAPPPTLAAVRWQLPHVAVELFARQTGVHRLRSGPDLALSRPAYPAPAGSATRRAVLAAAVAVERAGPALAPLARGGELPDTAAVARVTIAADVAPLAWVRLEVPDEALDAAGGNLQSLRLSDGASQLPFVAWSPPEPVIEAARELVFERSATGHSRARLPIAERPNPGRGQLVLYAPARPIERQVQLLSDEPSPRPGVPGNERWVGGGAWSCDPHPALPCRLALDLTPTAADELTIEIDDGDNPPLEDVRVELLRGRHELIFLWPETGRAELLSYTGLRAPRYDLSAYREALLRHPAAAATLGGIEGSTEAVRWPGWVLPAVVSAAALLLLGLLVRLLRAPSEADSH